MMDSSFLRLRNSFEDAKNLDESRAIELEYIGQVHLVPNETYLQITNNPTGVNLSNIEVYIVDYCDNTLADATNNVFWTAFTDSNGFTQIAWEFINKWDFATKPVALKFVELSNNDTYWTNFFITTDYRSEYTTRIDYKNNGFHYGTEYDRADYYQSIRLTCYYNNPINESERAEYHQISTDITVPQRNINKQKERFILDEFDYFTARRLEFLLSSSEIYFDNKRYYNTTPLEYGEREGDSNLFQGEMLLNPTDDTFTFSYQLFPGFEFIRVPEGNYSLATYPDVLTATFSIPISLGTGTLTVYDASDNSVLATYTESDITITNTELSIPSFTGLISGNGEFYINFTQGLVKYLNLEIDAIFNSTDWAWTIQGGDYSSSDYSNDYFI